MIGNDRVHLSVQPSDLPPLSHKFEMRFAMSIDLRWRFAKVKHLLHWVDVGSSIGLHLLDELDYRRRIHATASIAADNPSVIYPAAEKQH